MSILSKKSKAAVLKSGSKVLEAGMYKAKCIAVVGAKGLLYKSKTDYEDKLRFVFAVNFEDSIHYLKTSWMRISFYKDPTGQNSSGLWEATKAMYAVKEPVDVFDADGDFDPMDVLGKDVQLVVVLTDDEKYNNIQSYMVCKTAIEDQAYLMPEFLTKGDKNTKDVEFALLENVELKAAKVKDGEQADAAQEAFGDTESEEIEAESVLG